MSSISGRERRSEILPKRLDGRGRDDCRDDKDNCWQQHSVRGSFAGVLLQS
jgi:hypothetical protein